MCGIAGLMTFGDQRVAPELLRNMNTRMAHRGPDDTGTWLSPDRRLGLASRRLSIQDLSPAGHMPMSSADGRHWIVFNGEIYNFRALRAGLVGRGRRIVSGTDTEVLLHLYDLRGTAFLNDLEGMFAIALWDEQNGMLVLARDRMGEKPVYFADFGGVFRFASEAKAILSDASFPRVPDYEALNEYLTFGFVQPPRTLFRGIHKLAPGERMLLWNDGRRERTRYWRPLQDRGEVSHIRAGTAEVHAREIRSLFERSVEGCMVADTPVGAFLSGGVDSSAVVSMMSRATGRQVDSITVSYPDRAEADEVPFARLVARQTGANLHILEVHDTDAEAAFTDIVYHQDEPVADPACINTFLASREFRQMGVPVALVGEGADELFLGYPAYFKHHRVRNVFKLAGWFPRPLSSWAYRVSAPVFNRLGLEFHGEVFRRAVQGEGLFLSTDSSFPDGAKARLIESQLIDYVRRVPSTDVTVKMGQDPHGALESDVLAQISLAETQMRMAEQLLMRVDKLSMAHSVETRAPFLNWRLAEYALAIPGSVRAPGGRAKGLLKAALADLIPPAVATRPKQGFSTAVQEWFKRWAGYRLEARLKSSDLFSGDILSRAEVIRLLREHRTGVRQHHAKLWNLLCLAEWWDQYGLTSGSLQEATLQCQ